MNSNSYGFRNQGHQQSGNGGFGFDSNTSNFGGGGWSSGQPPFGGNNFGSDVRKSGFSNQSSYNYGRTNESTSSGFASNDQKGISVISDNRSNTAGRNHKTIPNDELLKEYGKAFLSTLSGKDPVKATNNPIVRKKLKNWTNSRGGGGPRFLPYGGGYGGPGGFWGPGPRDYYNTPRGYGFAQGPSFGRGYGYSGPAFNYGYNDGYAYGRSFGGGPGPNYRRRDNNKPLNRDERNAKYQRLNGPKTKTERRQTTVIKRLRDKYELNRKNKHISEVDQFLVVFMKNLFFSLSGDEEKEDVPLLLRFLMRHHNAVKCLRYELKKFLDKKYGTDDIAENIQRKKQVLTKLKDEFMDGYKNKYLRKLKQTCSEEKEHLVNETVGILSGETFTNEHFATDDDYVMDATKTKEDFINDFKYYFIKYAYESFKLRVIDTLCTTRDVKKRLDFHFENQFLTMLIVEYIKSKEVPALPEMAAKYVRIIPQHFFRKSEKSDNIFYKRMLEMDDIVVTEVSDYIPEETAGADPDVMKEFSELVVVFDKMLTVHKYKLMFFTPYIKLDQTLKLKLFNEMKDYVYKECLELFRTKLSPSDKTFIDMHQDPDYVPPSKMGDRKKKVKEEEKDDLAGDDNDEDGGGADY